MSAAGAIVRRDLRIESRRYEVVPAMTLLALGIFVLLHFGLGRDRVEGDLAAGVLWTAVLLGATLGLTRLYASEGGGRLDGLRLAPIDRLSLFIAKAAVLFCFLVVFEALALAAFAMLLLGPAIWGGLGWLCVVLLVADVALAMVGALVSAIATAAATRELLVPLLALPLMVPVMIAAAGASKPLLSIDASPAGLGHWLGLLGAYAALFALTAVGVFDELVEE